MGRALYTVLTASVFLLAAWSAQAKLLTWTLQNVAFDDGGSASGFFVFDPETIKFDQQTQQWTATPPTMFNLLTTGSIVGGEHRYEPPYSGADVCPSFAVRFPNFCMVFGDYLLLVLYFDAPLPVAGGTVPIKEGNEQLFEEGGFTRLITSGSVTTIPEPTSYAFLGVGVSLLALSLRPRGASASEIAPLRHQATSAAS